MTKYEQVKMHLRAIGSVVRPNTGWSTYAIVTVVEEETAALWKLLGKAEPETGTLVGTDLCNRLKEELDAVTRSKAYLRRCNNRLEQNLRALEEEVAKQKVFAANLREQRGALQATIATLWSIPPNTGFRAVNVQLSRKNHQLEQELKELRRRQALDGAYIEMLKHDRSRRQ